MGCKSSPEHKQMERKKRDVRQTKTESERENLNPARIVAFNYWRCIARDVDKRVDTERERERERERTEFPRSKDWVSRFKCKYMKKSLMQIYEPEFFSYKSNIVSFSYNKTLIM